MFSNAGVPARSSAASPCAWAPRGLSSAHSVRSSGNAFCIETSVPRTCLNGKIFMSQNVLRVRADPRSERGCGGRRVWCARRLRGSRRAGAAALCFVNFKNFDLISWKVLVLLTEAPLFCRDLAADVLLDFFLIMCDPSPLIPWPALLW